MLRKTARLLALLLLASSFSFAVTNFLFNYNLYGIVPTTLHSKVISFAGGSFTTPGFLELYLGTVVWAAASFVGLFAFLLLPASPRTPDRGAARQLARLVGLVLIIVGAFVALSCVLLLDKTIGLIGVIALLLGIVPFLCLPVGDRQPRQ